MHFPAWAHAAASLPLAQDIIQEQRAAQFQVADAPHTAPGWRFLGMDYSCIPDSTYSPDPTIIAAIQKIDPEMVPIWIRWVFLSPRNADREKVVVFGRHGYASHRKNPHSDRFLFNVQMPVQSSHPVPNQLDAILHNLGDRAPSYQHGLDLPGGYVPWDWSWVHSPLLSYSPKELKKRYITDAKAKHVAVKERNTIDREGRREELSKFVTKVLEGVSDVEWKEYFAKKAALRARRHHEAMTRLQRFAEQLQSRARPVSLAGLHV